MQLTQTIHYPQVSVSHRRNCFGDAPLVAFERNARGICRQETETLISSTQPFFSLGCGSRVVSTGVLQQYPGVSGLDFQAELSRREQDMLDAVKLALERDQSRIESEKASSRLKSSFESLTPREREIMALVASGLMNKQVAGKIGLSEITVKVHRGRIMQKMGARSLADLVRMAEALGVRPSTS